MANSKSKDQSLTEENAMVSNSKTVDNDLACAGGLDETMCPLSPDVLNQHSKTPSFQITSVYVGSNSQTSNDNGNDSCDELEESDASDLSVDTSRMTDVEIESSYCTEDTFSKDEVYIELNHRTIVSVPVIPTSSKYGLAIVGSEGESCSNDSSLLKEAMVCANNIRTSDESVTVTETGSVINMIHNTKSEIEMHDCPPQHASRNERFRVVKIVSTEPFKCGRWECMDYLDQNILQLKKSQLDNINSIKALGSDSSTGTVTFLPADSSVNVPESSSHCTVEEPVAPSHDSQFTSQQIPHNSTSVQAQPGFPNNTSPGQSANQERLVSTTQNSNTWAHDVINQNPNGNSQYQAQWFNSPQQVHPQSQQQSPHHHVFSQPPFNPQLQPNLQTHGFETQPPHHPSMQGTSQDSHVIYQPQFNFSQPQGVQNIAQPMQGTSVANHRPPETLQPLPPQQLQQLLNTFLHQLSGQHDDAQHNQIVQQVSQQLLRSCNWQNTPPTVETYSSAQNSRIGSPTVLMQMQNSVSGLSQTLQQQQQQQPHQAVGLNAQTQQPHQMVGVNAQAQQQQQPHQAVGLNAQTQQPHQMVGVNAQAQQQQQQQQQQPHQVVGVNAQTQQQPHQVAGVNAQAQQQQPPHQVVGVNLQTFQPITTKPMQLQQVPIHYTFQQFPAHQNQFQPFPAQQVPLVQLFPLCQPSSVQMTMHQQQTMQQNYQQIPNTQPSGQQFSRNVPVGDSQSAPNLSQGNNTSQFGLINPPGNHKLPSLQHGSQPRVGSSRSELFFTPPTSRTERQVGGSRSLSSVDSATKGLQSPHWFSGNGSCRFEMTSERPSLERLHSVLDVESGGLPEASGSGTSIVAIDNKIEQAMDLVKSHLMFAVREEVEVLKEKIADLMERITHLETENNFLRSHATPDVLAMVNSLPQPSLQPPQYPPKDST